MPLIKNKAQGLKWDAFPEEPPEAATWVPDPASIARPGQLKDPRFNKDPYEEARLRAARRDHGYHLHHSSEAVRMTSMTSPVNSPGTNDLNVGNWPPQAPRQTQPERIQSKTASGVSMKDSSNNKITEPVPQHNDTTKNLAVKPRISPRPAETINSSKAISRTESGLPAWAGPLEKALAEDTSRVPVLTNQTKLTSIPPHLRNSPKATNTSARSAHRTELDPMETSYNSASFDIEAQFEAACEATRRVSSSTTATRSEDYSTFPSNEKKESSCHTQNIVKQGAKLNSTLAKHDNEQPTNTSDEGSQYKNLGHYLKVSLVLTMQSYILERELLKLSEKELEERMLSVSSKHELLWEAEQARGKHS